MNIKKSLFAMTLAAALLLLTVSDATANTVTAPADLDALTIRAPNVPGEPPKDPAAKTESLQYELSDADTIEVTLDRDEVPPGTTLTIDATDATGDQGTGDKIEFDGDVSGEHTLPLITGITQNQLHTIDVVFSLEMTDIANLDALDYPTAEITYTATTE